MSEDQKTPIAATDEDIDQLMGEQLKTPEQIDAEEAAAARAKEAEKEAERAATREAFRTVVKAQLNEGWKQVQDQLDRTTFDAADRRQLATMADVGEGVKIAMTNAALISVSANVKLGLVLGQAIGALPKEQHVEAFQKIQDLMNVADEEVKNLADIHLV